MQQIENWLVTGDARIRGHIVGTNKGLTTSRVVSRDGNTVTTRSGSRYELVGKPHPFMTNNRALNFHWDKATSPLDAVDKMIQRREKVTQPNA